MQTTTKIIEALKCDYWSYDNFRHAHFMAWCSQISHDHHLPFSVLSTHDTLMNYFADQWHARVAGRLLREMSDLLPFMTADDMKFFLHSYAWELHDFYPSALLDKIRKDIRAKQTKF